MEQKQEPVADHDMLTGPVVRTYWKYCLPWILSLIATGSASIIDGIFVGRFVGAMPLAGINIIMPFWTLMSGCGVLLITGGSVRCGKYFGEGNLEAASAIMIKILIALLIIIGVLAGLGFALHDQVLAFLGADEVLAPYSSEYMYVLLWFAPAFPLCYAFSYFVRLDQRPVLASMGLGLSAIFNIALDALFIVGLDMGLTGAALATGLAYTVSCLVLATHFFSARSSYGIPARLGGWKEVIFAAWNGASEFINEVSAGIIILLFNLTMMQQMGPTGVAAYTVVGYCSFIGIILFYAIGDSLAPIISVNVGARAWHRMNAFLVTALVSVLVLELCFFALLSLAPEMLIRLFVPGELAVEAITLDFLYACRWSFLFVGLNMVLSSYFTGRQWALLSMLVAMSRSLALPVLMLMVLPRYLGTSGIYYVTTGAEGLTFLLAVVLFFYGHSRKRIEQERS